MTFGRYPDVSLAMARDRHREVRAMLATEVNPMGLRRSEKTAQQIASANSFERVMGRWFEHWADGKSLRHVDSVRRRMAAAFYPAWVLVLLRRLKLQSWLSDLLKKVEVYSGNVGPVAIKLVKPRGFYLVRSVVCFVLAFLLDLRFLLVGSALTSPYTCV
jgi:hypothetical protein